MIRKIFTQLKLMKNPVAWYKFKKQRKVTDAITRLHEAKKCADKINTKESNYLQLIREDDNDLARNFEKDGYIYLSDLLTPGEINDINNYLENQKMFDGYRLDFGEFDNSNVPSETHVGNFNADVMVNCPHIFKLANHPKVLSLVTRYLECKPMINNILGWRSFVIDAKPEHPQNYHRDVDDWKLVKLFLYLNDVDIDGGPHYYVKGSAYTNKCTEIKRFTDEEIEHKFGKENIVPHVAPRGTVVLEDTYGIHKGAVPKTHDRAIIQIVYTLNPLPYSPTKPLKTVAEIVGGDKLDKYINRIYIK
ncbi:phytanoyl-CoA dioxygenase family protein [Sulfurovum sp.]|uniref:phytanoyl-CoA dioxygenase family protein n=1 Tax=Sulfurovum sp. TaxID=1969726 RepID=UPI00356B08E4